MMRKKSRRSNLSLSLVIYLFAALGLITGNGIYGPTAAFSQEKPALTTPEDSSSPLPASSYTPPAQREPYPLRPHSKAKNVIFLIGDGMGLSQVSAARIKAVGPGGRLYIDKMPIMGLITTYSANNVITDSAAAGTALSTGYKTNNGMIGVNPEGKKLTTILEEAQRKGMATGLVVTSTITHATPASFASHVISRKKESTIAAHLLENKVNVLLGGGTAFFMPRSAPGGIRQDGRNLIEEARNAGYRFVQTKEELEKVRQAGYLLGLFQPYGLTTVPPEPSLADMADKAISLLSRNKKGFFLMIEGSQIDWAGHKNDMDYNIRQTLLFDEAVKVVMDFALQDKRTLVIITADHETGGMAINGGSLNGKMLQIAWTTKGHTGVAVPIYAFGPQAEKFRGLHDNTDIPGIIAEIAKITSFPPRDK